MEEAGPLSLGLPAQLASALKAGIWEIRVAGSNVHQGKRSEVSVEVWFES